MKQNSDFLEAIGSERMKDLFKKEETDKADFQIEDKLTSIFNFSR